MNGDSEQCTEAAPPQLTSSPALFANCAYLANLRLEAALVCSGVLMLMLFSCLETFSFTAGSLKAATTASGMRLLSAAATAMTMGPSTSNQAPITWPGEPCSTKVGMLAAAATRFRQHWRPQQWFAARHG